MSLTVTLPANAAPSLAGLTLNHVVLVANTNARQILEISQAYPLTLLP